MGVFSYESISDSFPNNVLKEFNYSAIATSAMEIINKELRELFNFIEPGLFDKKVVVFKNLHDNAFFPENSSTNLALNKAVLFNYNEEIVIQLFDDNNILMWKNVTLDAVFNCDENIIYIFESNKEQFFVKKKTIDITTRSFGSRYSDEFDEMELQLSNYSLHKIKYSTCPIFNDSWSSDKRIFFKGGGKDIPEKYMQESLQNFIKDLSIFKGEVGQFEPTREHNLDARKPVDIIVRWEKSNRIALIEIKWMGKSICQGEIKSDHNNDRANQGFKQLKEYFYLAKKDYPNKIIKCYLVVIDGRRWQTNEKMLSISYKNGMHYVDKEITLDNDKEYHLTYKNIHAPIRMFVEPICE
ncbi:hypothetical protein FACS189442_4160 [Spirochaetia bacterium]|nr:hypothetical protein FACS189442_4160 [Spirochaetia bacterium]